MRKISIKALLVALAAGGAAAVGVVGSGGLDLATNTPAAASAPDAIPVAVSVIESRPVRLWTEFSARLRPVDAVELRPQVSGEIVDVRFVDGERVEKGDILYVIDPRRYRAAVTEARSDLAAAKQQHILAGKELDRARSLIANRTVSESVLDERANRFAVTQSEIQAAEARLARAEVDLDHAFVKAPISGRVGHAEITLGNLVQAGANAPLLTTIVSDKKIYADFEVDEQTYLEFVKAGARGIKAERQVPVQLMLGGEDGMVLAGNIHTFDNQIDPATGTVRARALFSNSSGSVSLLPGMFVRVKLGSPEKAEAVMLSESAILTDQDRKFVYVVGDDGKAAYRQITIGSSVGGKRVVLTGLSSGDRVITSHLLMVRPDVPVAPRVKQADNTRSSVAEAR